MFFAKLFKLLRWMGAAAALVHLALPLPAIAQVGQVNGTSGQVSIRDAAGNEVPGKVGLIFEVGTRILTGNDGEVRMLFADGQIVTLSPNSEFRIADFRYDSRDLAASRATLNLVAGTMEYVSGAIHTGNPNGLRFSVGSSTEVRILSREVTSFVVQVDSNLPGAGSVAVVTGELSVQTTGGAGRVAVDQFVRFQPGVAPANPLPLAAAPAVIQASVAASRPVARAATTPIDFQSAATLGLLAQAQAEVLGNGKPVVNAGVFSGQVNSVIGSAFYRDVSGNQIPLKPMDILDSGTTITTGPNGQVGILFSDGQMVALNSNSILRVDRFEFDQQNSKGSKANLGLLSGRMQIVIGAVGFDKSENTRILAGNSVLEVLSKGASAFVVEVDPRSQDIGSVAVAAGEVSIETPDGPPRRISADQFTPFQPGTAPGVPQSLAAAPTATQAAVAASRAAVVASLAAVASVSQAALSAIDSLPATAIGPEAQAQAVVLAQAVVQAQAQAPAQQYEPVQIAAAIVPPVTPGMAGCVGSSC
jgi:hypothetical protein